MSSSGAEGPGPVGGKAAMHNGIQELPADTFALHVAGVFFDGRPAHMHSHPLRVQATCKQRNSRFP